MKAKLVASILIVIVGMGLAGAALSTIRAQESQPHYQVFNHREWYLQSLWQVQRQTPDNFILPILFGLSDNYIRNFVIPNTGEDFQTAKARITSSLGANPSDIEVHTAVVLESYAVGSCSGARDGQCYLLTITHWALGAQILGPLAGATVSYDSVTADDYEPEWADWNIPRPSTTGMPQPTPTTVAQESQPHYQVFNHREWYLQSLWQVQKQTPDNFILPILFGLSDNYIRNFVIPNTGEDFQTAKARITSSLGANPSDIEVHTAVVLESYAVGSCSGARDGQCYLLTITHWALGAQILGPLAGATVSYDSVTADDYEPEWADWNIPRPSTTGMPQPTPTTVAPTPTPMPTPAPWSNWDRFTHTDAGYSIAVAPRWGRIGYWEPGGGGLTARFGPLAEGGDSSDVQVKIYNDDPPLDLVTLAERERDQIISSAAQYSWQNYQLLSFVEKSEGGKAFYELVYRRQLSDDTCVKRVLTHIFTSDYPDKPYGFYVRYRVCENLVDSLSDSLEAMFDSFEETNSWVPIAVQTPIPNHITGSGTLVPLGDWTVTDDNFAIRVNSTLPNPEIEYGDPPASGRQFLLMNITVQNVSSARQSFNPYEFRAVGASAVEYRYSFAGTDGCGGIPGRFESGRDLFSGGQISANICFSIRNADVNSLVLYLDPDFGEDIEHWFDLGPPGGRDRYTNGVYFYRMDIAPGWILNEDETEPDFVHFLGYNSDGTLKAGFWMQRWYQGYASSLAKFSDEGRDALSDLAEDREWEQFEITSFRKKQGESGEYYELVYSFQTAPEYCVERGYRRFMLSADYPGMFELAPDDKPYGYILNGSVCEDSESEFRGQIEGMMGNFGEWLR